MDSNETLTKLKQKLENVIKENHYQFGSDEFRDNYLKSSELILDKLLKEYNLQDKVSIKCFPDKEEPNLVHCSITAPKRFIDRLNEVRNEIED